MVRGSPKRHRQAKPVKSGQERVEQRAIFERELAREPSVARVVDIQRGLNASEVRRPAAERSVRAAKLIAIGAILGMEDHEILSAGERQRIIQRLRLGARMKLGHHDDFHIAGKIERARRSDRVEVNCLEDQLDVELGRRPVEMAEAMDEPW